MASKKTLKCKAATKIADTQAKARQQESLRRNKPATQGDIEDLNRKLQNFEQEIQEHGMALALLKYTLKMKLGIDDDAMLHLMQQMRRGDVTATLEKMKGVGVSEPVLRAQCQKFGFDPDSFPTIFGPKPDADSKS